MTTETNPYCEALGIKVPRLEKAKDARDAKPYSLLIVVLLEKGGPVTLEEAAERFEQAGVAPAKKALASLKRCRPGRAPIYRDGAHYALDPHDSETDLWAFRLGLRPPKVPKLSLVPDEPGPLPSVSSPLSVAHLDEAWQDGVPCNASAQRLALCVLDAHGKAMSPGDVIAFVDARSPGHRLTPDCAKFWRRGAAIHVRDDGLWEVVADHDALRGARQDVIDRIEVKRRWAHKGPDPAVLAANQKRREREREALAQKLASMRRVLVHAFPPEKPEALVLLDLKTRTLSTYVGDEIKDALPVLDEYDFIAGVEIRTLLRILGLEVGARRLGELGPPQKTISVNSRGRKIKITTSLLIQSSCGISRPFGDETKKREYLASGEFEKLRRRLESDAKALYALYEYGCLHGSVRVCWGRIDEFLPAPWVHREEMKLYGLKELAFECRLPVELVVGRAPSWSDPWSRSVLAVVGKSLHPWESWLVDVKGNPVDEQDIQLARICLPEEGH